MGESEINVICLVELSYVLTLKYLVVSPDTIITRERSGNTPLVIASDNVNLETFADVVGNKV